MVIMIVKILLTLMTVKLMLAVSEFRFIEISEVKFTLGHNNTSKYSIIIQHQDNNSTDNNITGNNDTDKNSINSNIIDYNRTDKNITNIYRTDKNITNIYRTDHNTDINKSKSNTISWVRKKEQHNLRTMSSLQRNALLVSDGDQRGIHYNKYDESSSSFLSTTTMIPLLKNGLLMIVFNQRTAIPIFEKEFPVWKRWAYWSNLEWHLDRVSTGRIILLTMSPPGGSESLRDTVHLLISLGSQLATHLPFMSRWYWLFIKNGRTIIEAMVPHNFLNVHAIVHMSMIHYPSTLNYISNKYFMHRNNNLDYPLFRQSHLPVYYPHTYDNISMSYNNKINHIITQEKARWQYCGNNGVLSDLCNEINPISLNVFKEYKSSRIYPSLEHVPIIISGGKRYQYLYHTLRSIIKAPGSRIQNLHVVLGDPSNASIQLLTLLDIPYTAVNLLGNGSFSLYQYYREVYKIGLNKNKNAPAAIFIDEDVNVSPDFFNFVDQVLHILIEDDSLYCINAFSTTGLRGLAHDDSNVMRGAVQVGWGYVLTTKFLKEVLAKWLEEYNTDKTKYHDQWIYERVRGNRECIFPEVSRTKHFGLGMNTDPWLTERTFLSMPLTKTHGILLKNVENLYLYNWNNYLNKFIIGSRISNGNPCSKYYISELVKGNNVLYYELNMKTNGALEYENFFFAAKCLGAWSLNDQGQHNNIMIIQPSSTIQLFMVGWPASSLSYLKPKNVRPWQVDHLTNDEENEMLEIIKQNEFGSILNHTYLDTNTMEMFGK